MPVSRRREGQMGGLSVSVFRASRLVAGVRQWPLWQLPSGLVCYVLTVSAVALVAAAVSLATTPLRITELATWAALLTCATVSVEAAQVASSVIRSGVV